MSKREENVHRYASVNKHLSLAPDYRVIVLFLQKRTHNFLNFLNYKTKNSSKNQTFYSIKIIFLKKDRS